MASNHGWRRCVLCDQRKATYAFPSNSGRECRKCISLQHAARREAEAQADAAELERTRRFCDQVREAHGVPR